MRLCFCQFRADFWCIECHMFACFQHAVAERTAWRTRCPANPEHNHAFIPILQEGSDMRATKPSEALKEGRKFAQPPLQSVH